MSAASPTDSVVLRVGGAAHTLGHEPGESILETARRAGVRTPFSCEQGHCATCMARVLEGSATMRKNDALDADDLADGYVLTCQAVPTSPTIIIDFED